MTVLKEPPERKGGDKLQAAGDAAERQMAFYLRRAFGDTPDVFVINDLRLVEDGDAAQIDHLVLHVAGAVLIESKSVTQKVKVNTRGEWARWWDGQWRGMPSPIIQARQQAEFLRSYLQKRRASLRDKVLAGFVQAGFKNFDMQVLVAVSDNGIIERGGKELASEAMKADQVTESVEAILGRQRKAAGLGTLLFGKANDVRPSVRPEELERVINLLLAEDTHSALKKGSGNAVPTQDPWGFGVAKAAIPPAPTPAPTSAPTPAPTPAPEPPAGPVCKKCASPRLFIKFGKFGYYWKCQDCAGNTAIDKTAPDGSQGTLRKQGAAFYLSYGDGLEVLFHTNDSIPT